MKQVTLCFPIRNDEILLAMKKRGFGAGKWNGAGGKVQDEEIEDAMLRETKEELNIVPLDYSKIGELEFKGPLFHHNTHIYVCTKFLGEPQESEEMAPRWFNIREIPYADMWEGDDQWLPYVLTGRPFKGVLEFDEHNHVTSCAIDFAN